MEENTAKIQPNANNHNKSRSFLSQFPVDSDVWVLRSGGAWEQGWKVLRNSRTEILVQKGKLKKKIIPNNAIHYLKAENDSSPKHISLSQALETGNWKLINTIIASCQDCNTPCEFSKEGKIEKELPLIVACQKGDLAVIRLLLVHGANPSLNGSNGINALHTVSLKGHSEIVRTLLDCGADIKGFSKDNKSCLHFGVESEDIETVKILLANGADANALDSNEESPLKMAEKFGDKSIYQLLSGKKVGEYIPQDDEKSEVKNKKENKNNEKIKTENDDQNTSEVMSQLAENETFLIGKHDSVYKAGTEPVLLENEPANSRLKKEPFYIDTLPSRKNVIERFMNSSQRIALEPDAYGHRGVINLGKALKTTPSRGKSKTKLKNKKQPKLSKLSKTLSTKSKGFSKSHQRPKGPSKETVFKGGDLQYREEITPRRNVGDLQTRRPSPDSSDSSSVSGIYDSYDDSSSSYSDRRHSRRQKKHRKHRARRHGHSHHKKRHRHRCCHSVSTCSEEEYFGHGRRYDGGRKGIFDYHERRTPLHGVKYSEPRRFHSETPREVFSQMGNLRERNRFSQDRLLTSNMNMHRERRTRMPLTRSPIRPRGVPYAPRFKENFGIVGSKYKGLTNSNSNGIAEKQSENKNPGDSAPNLVHEILRRNSKLADIDEKIASLTLSLQESSKSNSKEGDEGDENLNLLDENVDFENLENLENFVTPDPGDEEGKKDAEAPKSDLGPNIEKDKEGGFEGKKTKKSEEGWVSEGDVASLASQSSRLNVGEMTSVAERLMKEQNSDEEEAKACVVCLDRRKSMLFLPCKHVCVCKICAEGLKNCPICDCRLEEKIDTVTQ